jgi:hypothetical protein
VLVWSVSAAAEKAAFDFGLQNPAQQEPAKSPCQRRLFVCIDVR